MMVNNKMILAAIPSPPQGVWHLGPLPIRAYALCILTGVVVAYFWSRARYAQRGGNPEVVVDALLVAVPAGIIGGRLYHVMTDYYRYFGPGKDPWQIFNITGGGLGIWGAIVLGTLAVWILFRIKKLPLSPFADAVAPTIILAQAIGRLGNWFNQELYGGPSTSPWALEIYQRVDDNGLVSMVDGHSTGQVIATVQPTFLYELLWNLVICGFLVWADRRFALRGGRVFALYVAGYTLGRFFIENMRTDPATLVFANVRINTVVSAVVFFLAVAVFIMLGRKQRRMELQEGRRAGQIPGVSVEGSVDQQHNDSASSRSSSPETPVNHRESGG